jgi:ribosomal protein S18 acetylase RimI-like enzyme
MLTIQDSFENSELPQMYEIEKECFSREFRWVESVFKRSFLIARKDSLVWVAYIGNKMAGYLLAGIENGKAVIETVNITKPHRHKGIASKLIAMCERDLKKRGYKEIRLEVWTENPAQILYFELGYRVCGFKRSFYKVGAHAVSMSKKL